MLHFKNVMEIAKLEKLYNFNIIKFEKEISTFRDVIVRKRTQYANIS